VKITEKIHCLKIEFNVGEKIRRFVNIYLLFKTFAQLIAKKQ
jgi:hypothetical protein